MSTNSGNTNNLQNIGQHSISEDEILQHAIKREEVVSKKSLSELLEFVNIQFVPAFLKLHHQYPWATLSKRVISPIIRVDMTDPTVLFTAKDTIRNSIHATLGTECPSNKDIPISSAIYEVETNPEGWHALAASMHKAFSPIRAIKMHGDLLHKVRTSFDTLQCHGFCDLSTFVESDKQFAKDLNLSYHKNVSFCKQGLWWVRTDHTTENELSDDVYRVLSKKSVTDVFGDSRKDYLFPLNLARPLHEYLLFSRNKLPRNEGWCIKPVFSTRSEGVVICPPGAQNAEWNVILEQVSYARQKYGVHGLIIMPYIPQDNTFVNDSLHKVILRMYLYWNAQTSKYEYLGGITTARPASSGEIINGSNDNSIFWPVTIEG